MSLQRLRFRYKNTLRHLVFLLLGLMALGIGLFAYFLTENSVYFYLIAFANIAVIYALFQSQVKKNQVVYDAIFIKYRINDEPIQRIKMEELVSVRKSEKNIHIQLQNDSVSLSLDQYTDTAVDEFYELLKAVENQNNQH